MGRHRKPIEHHQRNGTYKPSRHAGPQPETKKPEIPEDLKGAAANLWRDLSPVIEEMGIYTEADSLAFRLLCDSYGLYVEACRMIEEQGAYIRQVNKNGSEYQTEHPAAKTRSRHRKEIVELSRQFGLTPASRTGLHVAKHEGGELSKLDQILRDNRNQGGGGK